MRQDLRHLDNLLGNHRQTRGEELEDFRQLFHRLQHRSIESLGEFVHDAVVPLQLPLRPGLQQCLWPLFPSGPAIIRGKFIVLGRSHPGVGRPLAPWSVVRLGPCTSERRVLQGCGQLHAHGHPLVSQPRAERALPPPPRGAHVTFSHEQADR